MGLLPTIVERRDRRLRAPLVLAVLASVIVVLRHDLAPATVALSPVVTTNALETRHELLETGAIHKPSAALKGGKQAAAAAAQAAMADAEVDEDFEAVDDYDDDDDDAGDGESSAAADFPPELPFLAAVATCNSLECVKRAHDQPRGRARFNFPHFIILGFQKAATTSLFVTLAQHPHLHRSFPKDPEFFSTDCRWALKTCPAERERHYLRNSLQLGAFTARGGGAGHFEASTHYVRNGDRLVRPLKQAFPWVKVVVSLREPISRAASMLIHKKDLSDEGCLTQRGMAACLLEESQVSGNLAGAHATNYSFPMRHWVEGWPREQLHVIQYEELTSEEGEREELRRVKTFLEVDPDLPKGQELGVANARRFKIKPEGWPIRREQYEALVALVRPDAEATAALLEKGGQVGSARAFLERWERVWDDNLATCDAKGDCKIQLS